ncbi:MAG: CinA family protein [Actinomycetes bacterium]
MSVASVVQLLDKLRDRGLTLAVAESLTGGLLAAAFTAVPGASDVFRGGVVSYATDLKGSLLGVDENLLAQRGPVDAEVASSMAVGVARACRADIGVATTGVAGPDPLGDCQPGLVYIAVVGPWGSKSRQELFTGNREAIRASSVRSALSLLDDLLA